MAYYVPLVADSYQPRSQRTYNSYWRLTVELIGDVVLERVTVDDLMIVADEAARRAKQRRSGSDGRASRESCVAAMRAVFTRAHKAGLVPMNPALLVDKPRRLPNRRRALNQAELSDLWAAAVATTKDPELELMLLRFHLESGARRMGAINLRVKDLDHSRQTIWLREKFGSEREQPISRSLLQAVTDSKALVDKLWNCCSILRDDGLSYGDYVEQLTYLLFLKMAEEQHQLGVDRIVPEGLDWPSLLGLKAEALEAHYITILNTLGSNCDMLGVVSARHRTASRTRPSSNGSSRTSSAARTG